MERLPGQVNSQLSIFGLPSATLSMQIDNIRRQFTPYYQIWTTVYSFQTACSQWLHGNFDSVDAEAVERSVGQWIATVKYKKEESQERKKEGE